MDTTSASAAHNKARLLELRMACDELYEQPASRAARGHIRALLAGVADSWSSPAALTRQLRMACDELHAAPTDIDAQHTLLLILAAIDGHPPGA